MQSRIGTVIVYQSPDNSRNLTESVVTPNRPDHVYYHQKFRRVPTIDQCYTDDPVCRFEAQQQFNRDKYATYMKWYGCLFDFTNFLSLQASWWWDCSTCSSALEGVSSKILPHSKSFVIDIHYSFRCIAYEIPDQDRKCAKLKEEFDKVSESFCMKCKCIISITNSLQWF